MSRTRRRDWLGRLIRDGQHGHACPEPNCDTCVIAKTRRQKPLREDITASQAARRIHAVDDIRFLLGEIDRLEAEAEGDADDD